MTDRKHAWSPIDPDLFVELVYRMDRDDLRPDEFVRHMADTADRAGDYLLAERIAAGRESFQQRVCDAFGFTSGDDDTFAAVLESVQEHVRERREAIAFAESLFSTDLDILSEDSDEP